jgi:hypothetical protein
MPGPQVNFELTLQVTSSPHGGYRRRPRPYHTTQQRRYGHCQVPMGWQENGPLATWVSAQVRAFFRMSRRHHSMGMSLTCNPTCPCSLQRQEYQNVKKGRPSRMTTERLDKLNALNCIWDAAQKRGVELTSPPRKAIRAGPVGNRKNEPRHHSHRRRSVPSSPSGSLPHPVTALPPMMPRAAQPTREVIRPIQSGSQLWLPQPVPQSNSLPNLICLPQGQNHNNVTGPSAALVRLQQAHASALMSSSFLSTLGATTTASILSPTSTFTPHATPNLQSLGRTIFAGKVPSPSESRDTAAAPTTHPIQQALPLPSVRRIT